MADDKEVEKEKPESNNEGESESELKPSKGDSEGGDDDQKSSEGVDDQENPQRINAPDTVDEPERANKILPPGELAQVDSQSQDGNSYYADGSSEGSGDTDEQGRMKKVSLQGGSGSNSGGGGYYADGSSQESGDTDEQGRMKKVALQGGSGNSSAKQNARNFKKSKRKGGLLTKLGTGKVGRYGKAAMLTAGLMSPGGAKGMSAFNEGQVNTSQGNKINTEQKMSQQEVATDSKSPSFSASNNQETKSINYSDLSGMTAGDQSSVRRQLGQEKNKDRQTENKSETSIDNKSGQESVKGGWNKIVNARNQARKKIKESKEKSGASKTAAELVANQAVRKTWMIIHEVVEDTLIVFWPILFISGPIYLFFAWMVRPLLAMIGMMTIKINGTSVNLVPGYDWQALMLRAKGWGIILFVIAVEWAVALAIYEAFDWVL